MHYRRQNVRKGHETDTQETKPIITPIFSLQTWTHNLKEKLWIILSKMCHKSGICLVWLQASFSKEKLRVKREEENWGFPGSVFIKLWVNWKSYYWLWTNCLTLPSGNPPHEAGGDTLSHSGFLLGSSGPQDYILIPTTFQRKHLGKKKKNTQRLIWTINKTEITSTHIVISYYHKLALETWYFQKPLVLCLPLYRRNARNQWCLHL